MLKSSMRNDYAKDFLTPSELTGQSVSVFFIGCCRAGIGMNGGATGHFGGNTICLLHPYCPGSPGNFLRVAMRYLALVVAMLAVTGCAQIDKILTPDDRERVLNAVESARADIEATLKTVEDEARDELRRLTVERLIAP